MLLYDELIDWYRVLTPVTDYEEEAAAYLARLRAKTNGPLNTLLELGSGAGHNAFYFKRSLTCTLTDVSTKMLALSGELNPECAHELGDMRSLRLGLVFDAVFIHDAIVYMSTREDLLAALETASIHLRPGGAIVVAPDDIRETFKEEAQLLEGDDGTRSLQCLQWDVDPDPSDSSYDAHYSLLLRDQDGVRAAHDVHRCGLFSRSEWVACFDRVGIDADLEMYDVDGDPYPLFAGTTR